MLLHSPAKNVLDNDFSLCVCMCVCHILPSGALTKEIFMNDTYKSRYIYRLPFTSQKKIMFYSLELRTKRNGVEVIFLFFFKFFFFFAFFS